MMMMRSTRGAAAVTPSMAILRGLAPDGGLYVPESFPAFTQDEIASLAGMDYEARACFVLSRFLPDFSREELQQTVHGAYGAGFDCPEIAKLVDCGENTHALELWHGPTLAFKDMALQLLPRLLVKSAEKNGEHREIFILGATSGDTGKAALEGFLDVPGTRCCVFYPRDGVSRALPALWRSDKVQRKAAAVGYEWPNTQMAFDKLPEELEEVREAIALGDADKMEDELGDLLFATVKLARFLNVDPEKALHRSCDKFIRRFDGVEQAVLRSGKSIGDMTLEEILTLYKNMKAQE